MPPASPVSAPRIDPASHSVNVVAEIDGKHPELVAGMTGSVGPAETP